MKKMSKLTMLGNDAVTERHVQAIWYDTALRPSELYTVGGERVHVIDPGEWNQEAGPDFSHASILVDDRQLAGDVEVHLHPADWLAHGHAQDPAYAGVVAHVTWFSGRMPKGTSLPQGCVSICLGDLMRGIPDFSSQEIDVSAYPYSRPPTTYRPCATRLAGDRATAESLIRHCGRQRIGAKARRLAVRFQHTNHLQVLYEAMFVALGYKYNTFPFQEVAQTLPWRDVPTNPESARVCYETVAGLKATSDAYWHLANVRPANSPLRRLAAAAALFSQGPALCDRLMSFDLSTRRGQRAAADVLREGGHVGAGRAGAIMANAVVPYALAEGMLSDVPDWLLPEDVSAPVRQTAYRLLGRDHNPAIYAGNGLMIQGLLHIHHTFCRTPQPACEACNLVDF